MACRELISAAVLALSLAVGSAGAAVYFVDGACTTSGAGTSLGCGPSGPFATIADGIAAVQPGDTLNIRGAHDGFDGIYVESLMLRDLAPLPGKSLPCTAAEPCVIQGCRAPACPSDEEPTIRGMTLRNDWTALGAGVYRRAMEAAPNPDPLARDDFDPTILVDASTTPFTILGYAGDALAAPGPGQWSYDPATHGIVVHPATAADPAATILVPAFGFNADIETPTAYVTLQYLTFEGVRGYSIYFETTLPDTPIAGMVLSHLVQRYAGRKFIQTTRGTVDTVIEDTLSEYGGRGISFAGPNDDGFFGYRLFGFHNGIARRNTVRHIGATGQVRLSGGTAWPCPWCDPPWNDPGHTYISTAGIAFQVKQTDGATFEDNVAEDVSTGGISLDVSRHVTVQGNRVTRAATGIGMRNFTPSPGCPTTATTDFCYNSDDVIRANVLDDVGYADMGGCGITVAGGSERHVGATMLAQVYDNLVSHIGFGGICISNDGGTPTADVSVWNNTFYGARDVAGAAVANGLVVRDATQDVAVRDNAFDGLTGYGFVLTTAALGGLSLDGDVMGTVAVCQVGWDLPPFVDVPSGGLCDTLAGFAAANPPQESAGRTGPLLFADVTAVPPDLHLTPGSAAIDAGVPDPVLTDIDGDVRPQGGGWDAGADEFAAGIPTTTSTSTTTSSSTTVPTTTSSSTTTRSSTTTSTTSRTTTSSTSSTTTSSSATTSSTVTTSSTATTSSTVTTSSTTTSSTSSTSTSSSRTTSSTSATTPTTTTSTLVTTPSSVSVVGNRLKGQSLLLAVKPRRPSARRFRMVSIDKRRLTLGAPGDVPGLIAMGGTLRIVAIGGDGFAKTYDLDPKNWRLIAPTDPGRGVRYTDEAGAIESVMFETAKRLVVTGEGAELDESLDREPAVVKVELRIGSRAFCLVFGGEERHFAAGTRLLRRKAERPAVCPED